MVCVAMSQNPKRDVSTKRMEADMAKLRSLKDNWKVADNGERWGRPIPDAVLQCLERLLRALIDAGVDYPEVFPCVADDDTVVFQWTSRGIFCDMGPELTVDCGHVVSDRIEDQQCWTLPWDDACKRLIELVPSTKSRLMN